MERLPLAAALTTGSYFCLTGASYNPGMGNTGKLISIAFTNAATSAGTAIVTGLSISPTISAAGASVLTNMVLTFKMPRGRELGLRISAKGVGSRRTRAGAALKLLLTDFMQHDPQAGSTNNCAAIFESVCVGG